MLLLPQYAFLASTGTDLPYLLTEEKNGKFSVRHNIEFLSEVQATCFGLIN